MTVVAKHIRNLLHLEEFIDDYAKQIVKENADEIIRVLQDKQLGLGQYSTGRPLKWSDGTGFYSEATQLFAQALPHPIKEKAPGDAYNFQWTGSTFDSMVLEADANESYSIFSRDGKEAFLKKTYGDKLFKLSEKNNKWINQNIIEPKLAKFIEENWWLPII
jgi:hypothetical protein